MLALDDARWIELDHRGWSEGRRYPADSDAPYVPDELALLRQTPSDIERFGELWPYLCSEGTSWAAAYAVVPYTVALARRLPPVQRFEYLVFVGLVVIYSCPNDIKPYLVDDYRQALLDALALLGETLTCKQEAYQTRYLVATIAALKGCPKLGEVIANLDCISGKCPQCGESVYPEELEQALV